MIAPSAMPAGPAASPAEVHTARADRWAAFVRRLAETTARALAGDPRARQVMNEYHLACWCGHRPDHALTVAEQMVASAWPERGTI